MHRWTDRYFAAHEDGDGSDTEIEPTAAEPEQTVLKPAPQTNWSATGKANSRVLYQPQTRLCAAHDFCAS